MSAVKFSGLDIVGTGSRFSVLEHAKMIRLPKVADIRHPLTLIGSIANALVSTSVLRGGPSVHQVPVSRGNAHVGSPTVKAVPVDVVYNKALRWVHQESVQAYPFIAFARAVSIAKAAAVFLYTPVELANSPSITSINDCEVALSKRHRESPVSIINKGTRAISALSARLRSTGHRVFADGAGAGILFVHVNSLRSCAMPRDAPTSPGLLHTSIIPDSAETKGF